MVSRKYCLIVGILIGITLLVPIIIGEQTEKADVRILGGSACKIEEHPYMVSKVFFEGVYQVILF